MEFDVASRREGELVEEEPNSKCHGYVEISIHVFVPFMVLRLPSHSYAGR